MDRSGGAAAEAIEARLSFEADRQILSDLSRYVRRYDLQGADPSAPWAQSDRWYTPADIMAFREAGGLSAAVATIDDFKKEETPAFEADPPDYAFVPAPAPLAQARGDALASEADRIIDADSGLSDAERADIVLVIPETYPADPTVKLWSNEQPRQSFMQPVQEVLTADLRQRLLTGSGMSAQQAAAVQGAAPRMISPAIYWSASPSLISPA